ncbi:hypothetical protein ACFE04_001874 [Oxalis oulophora]
MVSFVPRDTINNLTTDELQSFYKNYGIPQEVSLFFHTHTNQLANGSNGDLSIPEKKTVQIITWTPKFGGLKENDSIYRPSMHAYLREWIRATWCQVNKRYHQRAGTWPKDFLLGHILSMMSSKSLVSHFSTRGEDEKAKLHNEAKGYEVEATTKSTTLTMELSKAKKEKLALDCQVTKLNTALKSAREDAFRNKAW